MEHSQREASPYWKEEDLFPLPPYSNDSSMSKESSSLSVFDLDDIPPTPTGFFPQIPVVSFSNFAGFDSKSSLSADVEASKFELRSPNPLPATTASYFYQPCADFIQPNSKRDSTAIPPAKDVFGPEKRLDVSEEEQHLRWVSERNNYPREETDPTCFPGLNSTEGIRHHGIGPDAGRLRPSEEESTKSYDEGVSEGYPKVYLENLEVYAAKDTPWTEAEATSSIFECQVGESSDPEWWSEASSPDSAKAASLSELLPFAKEAASLLFEKFLTQRFGTSWRTRGGTQDSSQSSVASGFSNTTTVSSVSSRSTSGKGTESLSRTSRKRPSDDEDDRRPTQRRRVELISRDFKGQLLACPFAKNKPLKHAKCFKYIIQEIARLKQHVLRVHQIPVHCPRCSQVFATADERDIHFRETSVCTVQPAGVWDGVSETQKTQLAKRVSSKKSKEENWYLVYEILFPNSPKPDSPYIDDIQLSEELLALREFTMQEAPARISAFARSKIPEELRSSQDQVEAFAQAAVRDLFDMVIERWLNREHSQNASTAASNADLTNGSESACFNGSNSSPPPARQDPAELVVSHLGDENTAHASSLPTTLFGTTPCEDSGSRNGMNIDTLDWFLPMDNPEFLF